MMRRGGIILLIAMAFGLLPLNVRAQESLTETYRSVDGTLSLQYPAGWDFSEGSGLIFAGNRGLDDLYINGQLQPDSVNLVIVTPFYTRLMVENGVVDASAAVENLRNLLALPAGTAIGTPEVTTIGDLATSRLIIDIPDHTIVVAVVNVAQDVQVATVWFTLPAEFAFFQPTLLDIVASMRYTPPPAPVEVGEMVWQVQQVSYSPDNAIEFGSPGPLAVGPDDLIYLAAEYGTRLYTYSAEGEFVREMPLPDGMAMNDLAIMPDGSLWVTDAYGGQVDYGLVTHLSATGEVLSTFELPLPEAPLVPVPERPAGVVLGPDGLIYVGYLIEPPDGGYRDIKVRVLDDTAQLVREFMVATDVPQLDDMTIGPDGNLYLLVSGRLQVFDLQGNLLRSPHLLLPGVPWSLEVGSDGTLYMYLAGASVVILENDGTYRGQFGRQQAANDDSELDLDELKYVMGLAVLSNGDVVMTDTNFNFARLSRISIK